MVERRVIVGVFQGRAQAEKAVHDLEAVGLNEHQISFAIRQPDEQGEPKLNISNDQGASPVGKVPLTGAATGGVVGGVAGALTALLIPGIGPVLAGGILAGILIGAAAGDMVGTLVGMGMAEEQAKYYEEEFKQGRALVMVNTTDPRLQKEAEKIMDIDGAIHQRNQGVYQK
ncbi:MAG TPA: hypothetical protein VKV40_01795 [Ktedonobacteraceae bacterium]|nr:hypothetical protein [Ktedonobacteraceae bacterium]